jgi:hypothetical protein
MSENRNEAQNRPAHGLVAGNSKRIMSSNIKNTRLYALHVSTRQIFEKVTNWIFFIQCEIIQNS